MIRSAGIAAAFLALALARPAAIDARVDAPTQIVAAAQIIAVADGAAREALADRNRALAPALRIRDQIVPAGALAIVGGVAQVNASYVSVPVALRVDGRVVRTLFAGYRITSYIQTAVAAHDLGAEHIITSDDLAIVRVPYAGRAASDGTALIGRKVRVPLVRGDVIYPEATAVNELVHPGHPALLIVHDGNVALCADVVASTGGGLGDSVTVLNAQTHRALSGIVTGPNVVELTLPGSERQ